jgi:hypothetical protein
MLNSEISAGIEGPTLIGDPREWVGRAKRGEKGRSQVFAKGSSRRYTDPAGPLPPGGLERRIVAEVAVQLRISPRFSDDGAPEGTCDRPLSIQVDGQSAEEESEHEVDLTDELTLARRDGRGR